ncbi:hypothetical protein JTB14_024456 [Gonioctena quinquepunctata]|nr:hypothetical protein JTB14_024456 [Gonioctena quinquepunctata]
MQSYGLFLLTLTLVLVSIHGRIYEEYGEENANGQNVLSDIPSTAKPTAFSRASLSKIVGKAPSLLGEMFFSSVAEVLNSTNFFDHKTHSVASSVFSCRILVSVNFSLLVLTQM